MLVMICKHIPMFEDGWLSSIVWNVYTIEIEIEFEIEFIDSWVLFLFHFENENKNIYIVQYALEYIYSFVS